MGIPPVKWNARSRYTTNIPSTDAIGWPLVEYASYKVKNRHIFSPRLISRSEILGTNAVSGNLTRQLLLDNNILSGILNGLLLLSKFILQWAQGYGSNGGRGDGRLHARGWNQSLLSDE